MPEDLGLSTDDGSPATVVLRPVGAPLPTGFLALAVGSLVLSGSQLHWIAADQGHAVALCVLAFVVPLQLISAVFGFLARDAVAGTGMSVLAGTWLGVGAVLRSSAPGQTSPALGLQVLGSAAALVAVAATAALFKPLAAVVIGTTALRFACTGVYELTGDSPWRTATGLIGLPLSAIAWYAALAFLLESVAHRPVLPTFRRDDPAGGTRARLRADTEHVFMEAGVRSPA